MLIFTKMENIYETKEGAVAAMYEELNRLNKHKQSFNKEELKKLGITQMQERYTMARDQAIRLGADISGLPKNLGI